MKRINQITSRFIGQSQLPDRNQLPGRALQALSEPIVCLGPGGDFVTQIVADEMGEMIFVSQNSGDSSGQTLQFIEQPIDWLERLFGIGGRLVGHTVQESPLQEKPRGISAGPISTTPAKALEMIRNGRGRGAPPPTVYVYRRVTETYPIESQKNKSIA